MIEIFLHGHFLSYGLLSSYQFRSQRDFLFLFFILNLVIHFLIITDLTFGVRPTRELILPFSPVIPYRVDAQGEEEEDIAPHNFPEIGVQLQEQLTFPEGRLFDDFIIAEDLNESIDC